MNQWIRKSVLATLLALAWPLSQAAAADTLIPTGAIWKYLDNGSDQGTNWITPSFNDAAWLSGPAELGYGDASGGRPEATVVEDNATPGYNSGDSDRYITTYFRHSFNVPNPAAYAVLQLRVLRDDGVVLYLNGREIFRDNMPSGDILNGTPALVAAGDDGTLFVPANVSPSFLVAGPNVLAAEIHQNAPNSSDISFDFELIGSANTPPAVSILSPSPGAFFSAPATIVISANATDGENNLTLVEFYQGTTKLGEDATSPYAFNWTGVPLGNYALQAVAIDALGARSTSAVVNVTVSLSSSPTIASKLPAPGNVASLTNITVTFSENVTGVNASDLLVNGVPALSVSGSGTTYTFAVVQPGDGAVMVGWNGSHGIGDFENPPKPFDPFGAGASWQYTLTDTVAPAVALVSPLAGTALRSLDKITVTFTEPVFGVNAADLRLNNVPATSVSGDGAGPYEFHFAPPANGALTVAWAVGHGITDRAGAHNAFVGASWSYNLNTNTVWDGQIIINEIMYHPGHNQAAFAPEPLGEEYIELFNRGASAVNLAGWRLDRAVNFLFPNTNLPAGGYLVVAANVPAFRAKYPAVTNVVGGWLGRLSNNGDEIELEDPSGTRVDLVAYADEGDWSVRTSTGLGWVWTSAADGTGSSLELRQGALDNNRGQNWRASSVNNGTPGRVNSVVSANIAPMILDVSHLPAVPRSTNTVTVLARILDENASGLTVRLWRRDATALNAFISVPMLDNGLSNDGLAGDGLYGVVLPPQGNGTITEFYVEAIDAASNARTWPAAADMGGGNVAQEANAFFQVDDEVYPGKQAIYRIVMRSQEQQSFFNNFDRIERNATFITIEGSDVQIRYSCGARRRGASSFGRNPPTFKFSIPSDRPWNNKTSFNLNSDHTYAQVLGSAISLKAGLPTAHARGAQLRFNGVNQTESGGSMFGSYAHVEVADAEFARDHFGEDGDGNVYNKRRPECGLEYLGTNPSQYFNCAFTKESNSAENDWSDLVGLFFALDPDTTAANDYVPAVRRAVNVELWMRYFAVLFLLDYNETALSNGADDDYDFYRGLLDPRFIILPHDFDSIFGSSGGSVGNDIFLAGRIANINRFLHHPEFEPLYYAEFRHQLAGTFNTNSLFPLIDQTLGDWVPVATLNAMKANAAGRISTVLAALPAPPVVVRATLSGEPDSPTYLSTATLLVSGTDLTHYRYRLNGGAWSADQLISQPISLAGLTNGLYTLSVVGRNSAGIWQFDAEATLSKTWVVLSNLRGLVINEVLARNDSAFNHEGTFPDFIELFNAGASSVDLTGLRLTDDLGNPNKFIFPSSTLLPAGAYRVVFANDPDGTSGLHTGFGLSQDGNGVYLIDRITNGVRVMDSVKFGAQLSNLSVGRLSNGQWGLSQPTAGSANISAPVGNVSTLKINEWLASPASPFVNDFIELYNPDALPVNLGGAYLTDLPYGAPFRHAIAPLSFIDGFGYRFFLADPNSSAGPNHLNFSLSAEIGEIALSSPGGDLIDCVVYGQQFAGRSQGRSPNGGSRIVYFDLPTPGAGNPVVPSSVPPQTTTLFPLNGVWKYEDTGTDLGTSWSGTSFNDSTWPSGPALLGFDGNFVPVEPLRTPLAIVAGKMTCYFRTHVTVPAGLNITSLQAVHLTDDGAVFYINGQEAGRYNMPAAPSVIVNGTAASANVEASFQTTTLSQSSLRTGDNVLAVEVHQSGPGSADLIFGLRLDAITITNNPALAGITINEVMANPRNSTNSDGTITDWVELYNPSTSSVDLSGMSLTDQLITPRRWIFPQGSIIAAQGYRLVRFDANTPATTNFAAILNTGFGLKASGDSLYLYNRPQGGGELLDAISFGVQAPDWSIGRVPNGGSSWVLTLPTPDALNIATTLGNSALLKINEWMAAPNSGGDWFELFNPSAQPVELSGLYLTDDLNNRFKYPPMPARSYMAAGLSGFLKIVADNDPAAGADHVPFALSRFGEQLGLADRYGSLIDQLVFGEQTTGVSQGRLPDGTTNIVSFPGTETPEESNFLPIPNVVINEVLTHSDPPFEDAIELRNIGAGAVNVSGWYLSDARTALRKFRIPNGTTIASNGFRVFYETNFNAIPNDAGSFSLSSANGDEVYLSAVDGLGQLTGYRTVVNFGPAANGVSFGRYITSTLNGNAVEFTAMSARTFGVDNPPSVDDFRTGTGLANSGPLIGPVVISEIMYHPPDLTGGLDDVSNEFIELRNITASSVKLYHPNFPSNTWKLKDAVSYSFPLGLELPGNGFLIVVSFDPTNTTQLAAFRSKYAVPAGSLILGPYKGKLDHASDSVELARPDVPQTLPGPDIGLVPYILVDKVHYSDLPPWPSCGPNCGPDGGGQSIQRIHPNEYGNDPINWMAGNPNPGPQGDPLDTDTDGMPDSWELQYGLNVGVNDAQGDLDHDGMTNLEEYLAGTFPNDATSSLRLQILGTGPTVLRFNAVANKSYRIEYKDHLGDAAWTKLADVPSGTARPVQVNDPAVRPYRFYHVRTP